MAKGQQTVFKHKEKKSDCNSSSPAKNISFIPGIRILDSVTNTFANLEMKDYVKYLGLMIDSNLSWKYDIESVCYKISKSKGIAKIQHYILPRVFFQFTTH